VGHPAREYHRVSHHRLFRDFDRTGRPLLRKLDDTPVRQDPERAAGICAERTQGNSNRVLAERRPLAKHLRGESFIDELAAAAKKDPVEYRRALLDKSPRAKAVLDLAAEKSGWGQPLPKGSGRGVSVQNVFGSYMAQVAEVAVSKDGDVAVKRITCAVDCGIGINPNTIEAQAQSAILYGLTAALYGEITLKDGRVEQSNFDSYRALRINEIPAIDIHIIDSGEAPGGMGEPETCAVPPAVTNAIFAATGVRLRKLPIDTSKLKA
jgi:isoquinoline 1-oxidoreductase beta subunit